MSAKTNDDSCKQGGGETYHGQRPWQEPWSVLYIVRCG